MNGIIIIDKPKDFTSFDVVAVMRKICGTKKIGHTGTLDPMVTGVLPILVGNATKAQSLLKDTDKSYIAKFKLGIKTDTQDISGKILETSNFDVSKEKLKEALYSFKGESMQIPPMYSAVKHNGIRLYDLARKGITVKREARPINISKLELLSFDENKGEGSFKVSCSKGTYIRTLCHDLGKKLSTYAVMTELRRTKACSFTLDDAITLEQAKLLKEKGQLEPFVKPTAQLFDYLDKIAVSKAQTVRFKNGGALSLERLKLKKAYNDNEYLRVFSSDNEFLGLGKISLEKKELLILKLF